MEQKFADAEAILQEAMAKGGDGGKGSLWWIERELEEVRKYLPKRKQ